MSLEIRYWRIELRRKEEVLDYLRDNGSLTHWGYEQAIKLFKQQRKVTKMNPTIVVEKAVEKVTYVYGTNIRTMSKEELLNAIRLAKREITSLTEANIESTYITKEVKRINKAIKVMIKRLDA